MRKHTAAFAAPCAILAVALASGCGPRDRAYDPSNFKISGPIVPYGVVTGPSGKPSYRGIYAEDAAKSLSCCWIAPRASFFVEKRAPAKELVAGIFLPNVPAFAGGATMTFRIGTPKPSVYRVAVRAGQQTVRLPLAPAIARAAGRVPVTIESSVDYVPAQRGDGADTRRLGAVLLYVYFQ